MACVSGTGEAEEAPVLDPTGGQLYWCIFVFKILFLYQNVFKMSMDNKMPGVLYPTYCSHTLYSIHINRYSIHTYCIYFISAGGYVRAQPCSIFLASGAAQHLFL